MSRLATGTNFGKFSSFTFHLVINAPSKSLQVAFHRFLDQNWGDIAAMYEDKHLLWGCGSEGQLVRRPIPMRRAKVRAPGMGQGEFYVSADASHDVKSSPAVKKQHVTEMHQKDLHKSFPGPQQDADKGPAKHANP